jgi:hypothetical protein
VRIKGEITRRHLNGKGNEKYINKFDTEKLKENKFGHTGRYITEMYLRGIICEDINSGEKQWRISETEIMILQN